MGDSTVKLFSRIKATQDGIDFLNFLESMSKENYEEFKRASSDMNDICKGKALALDALIKLFYTCDIQKNVSTQDKCGWGV